jgi:hypothetical protein
MIKLTTSSMFLVVALFVFAAPISSGATAPTWGTIAGITIGTPQATVIAQHGPGSGPSCAGRQMCLDYHVYGKVAVVFAGGKAASVSCGAAALGGFGCPAGFALPDGVFLGMTVPAGKGWRGYSLPKASSWVHVDTGATGQSTWSKSLRVGSSTVYVVLGVAKAKVVMIGYAIG